MAGAGAGNPAQVERLKILIEEQQPDFLAPYAALSEALITGGRYSDAIVTLEEVLEKTGGLPRGN